MSKYQLSLIAFVLAVGFASGASAQSQMLACQTPSGVFPMPGGIPQPGLPCFGPAGQGVTIFVGGGFPGGQMPMPMPQPFPGGTPGNPMPAPMPFPGGAPGGFPGGFPGGPFRMPAPIPVDPMGPTGQVAGAFGLNHEGQVTADCVAQFGVSYATGGCVAGRLTADELNKCFTDGIGGRGCFGDNNTLISMIRGNVAAAQRESTLPGQVVRGTTGISIDDIRDRGPLGGDNSEARKACNAVAGIFGGKC